MKGMKGHKKKGGKGASKMKSLSKAGKSMVGGGKVKTLYGARVVGGGR